MTMEQAIEDWICGSHIARDTRSQVPVEQMRCMWRWKLNSDEHMLCVERARDGKCSCGNCSAWRETTGNNKP